MIEQTKFEIAWEDTKLWVIRITGVCFVILIAYIINLLRIRE